MMPLNTQDITVKASLIRAFFLWFSMFLVLCASCNDHFENGPRHREPHFDLKNECQSIGPSTSGFGFVTEFIGTLYDHPMFNPNDPDELLYHEWGQDFSRLMKYRISTDEKKVFLEDVPQVLELDWGRGGWIAFSGYADMYLIREDGTNLHTVPLTSRGHSCAEPDFNPDGTVVGFPFGGVDGIALYGEYLLYDLQTSLVDTFKSYGGVLNNARPLAWSSTNRMAIPLRISRGDRYEGMGYVDMTSLEKTLIFKFEDRRELKYFGRGDVQWNHTGQFQYNTGGGIICYPINEYKEIRIKKSCESRYYQDIAISPDDRHIVVERVDVRRLGPFSNTLERQHRLFIMDIDGCNERPLF